MTQDNVIKLAQPGTFSDPLTEILRNGARALLAHAVEAEIAGFLGDHADKLTADGRARVVRHGHLPEREIVTGIGPVAVRCPRVRDRAADGGERIRFSSAILPPYARRSKSLEVLIPILYLKGVSTGDFEEALVALLGKDTSGLSASAPRIGHEVVPIWNQWSPRQVRHAQIDLHLQALEVRKVDPPTPWSEDAVIKQDVGVDFTRKNHASHHQVRAHDANTVVTSSQAIRELLREHD